MAYYSATCEPSVACLEKWIDLVWIKAVSTPAFIILDSYEVHSQLENKFQACTTQSLTIPSGCSVKLQPLNVHVKKEFLVCSYIINLLSDLLYTSCLTKKAKYFQKNLEKLWLEYLQPNGYVEGDSSHRIKLPTATEVVEWVQKSYEATLLLKVFN